MIYQGQKFYEIVTDENNAVRIGLVHFHIAKLLQDGRLKDL
jgi:hypothetical protein